MIRWAALWICAIPFIVGCGGERPPDVRFGEEACAHCRMIINDDRFAAARILESGEALKFDDVGCLVDHLADDHGEVVARNWVLGYQSGQWLDAERAHYVYGPQLQTPMAYGLAAVVSQEEAKTLARDWGGRALRWSELPAFFHSQRAAPPQKTNNAEPDIPSSNTNEER